MPDVFITSNLSSIMNNWVELYADSLYSWAFHKTSSKETAEDFVKETFLAAVQSFENIRVKAIRKCGYFQS
ncbi:RNA polymerase sigma factor [Flavobacterium sp. UBA6031]|uniref:RNA polymerase sigma factor n=1 Tax=Flavobacterium sp. UBA6031 TaxID=1946551 RepID=UPI0025BCA1C8|nr:sigma factor [Flavobacterium sp. UBA6031]